jgi:hypothetical protein
MIKEWRFLRWQVSEGARGIKLKSNLQALSTAQNKEC